MIQILANSRAGILLLIAVLIFSGCATKKRKGDVSKLKKFYHSTTTKYNGHFNANIIYEETLLRLKNANRDNYTQILPLYAEQNADAKAVATELDDAVEKLSTVISIHRVGEWTDDSYYLMGKVQHLKQDYEAAEETLEFFEYEFDPVSVKKKNDKIKAKKTAKEKRKERKEKIKSKEKKRKELLKERKRRIRASKKGKRLPPVEKSVKEEPKPTQENSEIAAVQPTEPEALPDAKSGFFVHENVYPDGLVWLARTYMDRGKYSLARSTLNKVAVMPMTDIAQYEYARAEAYYFLSQGQYNSALPKLQQAIELSKDRNERGRMEFIAGQIHQRQGNRSLAVQSYSDCVKSSTDYEMEFHANLNKLLLERAGGEISQEEYSDALAKMLKDDKNLEYSGYIHLSLAAAAMETGRTDAALGHMKEALKAQEIDGIQRSEAYLGIADIYFSRQKYADAKDYYDSTALFITADDGRYVHVKTRSEQLKNIAENIRIIELQDSLLAISKMSLEDRKKLVAEMKEKDRLRAEKEQEEAGAVKPAGPSINKRFPGANAQALLQAGTGNLTSSFFAYDQRNLKKGQRSFEKDWGDRELEDDWRRSNKQTSNFYANNEEEQQAEEVLATTEVTVADINKYLAGVPTNPKELAATEKKLMDAYFDLGKAYRDDMLNNERAVEALETLLERYPDSPHSFDAWFLLYLAHKDLGNTNKADYYAGLIVEANPESKYAMVITDPNFVAKTLSEEEKLVKYYDETYALFTAGDYNSAFERIEGGGAQFSQDHHLVPRFALLKAMCLAKLESKESYVAALKEVVAKYPETPESVRAKEILRFLQGDESAFEQVSEDVLKETKFTLDDASLHYVITIIFDIGENTLDQVKIAAANYNRDKYRNQKFRVSHNMLSIEPEIPLIMIRKFDSKSDAMRYAVKIEDNPLEFMPKGVNFEVYAIHQQNYRELMSQRSVNEYRLFYAKNYRDQ